MAATATATSKSAVSRRSVAATETALAELLGADLSGLDLVAFMVDGEHFAESRCVVALGIGVDAAWTIPSTPGRGERDRRRTPRWSLIYSSGSANAGWT